MICEPSEKLTPLKFNCDKGKIIGQMLNYLKFF